LRTLLGVEEVTMVHVYSTADAKARFSEVIRRVRGGNRVVVTWRGEHVAEIRPVETSEGRLGRRVRALELLGVIQRASVRPREVDLAPLAPRPGALERFLESRE